MTSNTNLHRAKAEKNDEFYTRMVDIEKELRHYKHHFKDRTIYCNCDNPSLSNFYKYFRDNFESLGLRMLICSYHDPVNPVSARIMTMSGEREIPLEGNGDFRSPECIELLKEADIVVTNPPFSLFRDYLATIMKFDKRFIVIGSTTAIGYSDIFPYIKENKLWLGVNHVNEFVKPNGCIQKFGNIIWYTDLDHEKRHMMIPLTRTYNMSDYPSYDNYDAIDVSRTMNIPVDYNGVMGVPLSFMERFNPDQFEIIRFRKGNDGKDLRINVHSYSHPWEMMI